MAYHQNHDVFFTQFVIFIFLILPSAQDPVKINQNPVKVTKASKLTTLPTAQPPPVPLRFGEKDAVHDTAHIKKHLKRKLNVDKILLSKEKETFHYFRMHDSNGDGKIDGIELMKEITHLHEEMTGKTVSITEMDLEKMVSDSLREMDIDDDGYITYAEYKRRL